MNGTAGLLVKSDAARRQMAAEEDAATQVATHNGGVQSAGAPAAPQLSQHYLGVCPHLCDTTSEALSRQCRSRLNSGRS
jgi:hypothetical protein